MDVNLEIRDSSFEIKPHGAGPARRTLYDTNTQLYAILAKAMDLHACGQVEEPSA